MLFGSASLVKKQSKIPDDDEKKLFLDQTVCSGYRIDTK